MQPLDDEVQNDKEQQADTQEAEAEVLNLKRTDNTPKEQKERDADAAKNTQLAANPQLRNAAPTDLGPRGPSAVPSQGSSVGLKKLWLDTARDGVNDKKDHRDKGEDSGASDDSDAPVRLHPESRGALQKNLKEDRADTENLHNVLRNAEVQVVSRL